MLDIKFIRENLEEVKDAVKKKSVKVDIDQLLKLDEQRKDLLTQIEELRTKRNELARAGKQAKPTAEQIIAGKKIKEEIFKLEHDLNISSLI